MKLSDKQSEALEKLAMKDGAASSYDLQVRLNTLEALARRELVKADYEPGYMWWPQTSIKWTILAAGREALAREEGR